jgi:hypothetical protein
LALTRVLTDFENHLRSELIAKRADPYDVSSPRDELEKFRFFARQVELFIDQAEQSEVESLRQSVQHLPKDTQDEFWMWNYPVHWDEIFRSTIRGSVVVSLATFIETFLERLCYRVSLVTESELRASDLKGSTLERTRRFLQVVGHFQKPISSEWEEIGLFYKIRNVIIHNAGFAAKSNYKKAIERFCRNRSDIRLHHDAIEIEPEYLEFMINQLLVFIDQLENEFLLLCEQTRRLGKS